MWKDCNNGRRNDTGEVGRMEIKFKFDPTLFGHSFFITLLVGFSIIAIFEHFGYI